MNNTSTSQVSQWVQAEPPALLCRPRRHITMDTRDGRSQLRWGGRDDWQQTVHHVCTMSHGTHMVCTMSHGVHHVTWCAPCHMVCTMWCTHMVCTMWCTPCVHHVHTHGVPSGLIPWYLGTCPKQFLYEIFRWPLTWPRYRSKVRTCLNPYSFLVLKKTWWYSVERVSMSRPKKVSSD